jgi:aryl-alcohol dehydrogenase-like predicted oxidoreductase
LSSTKIGLGLAALGRPEYINLRSHDDPDKSIEAYRANAFRVMDFAYEKGIRHFDTAASYGKGEQFLLDWNKKHRHHDVTISSKWGYSYVANWEIDFKGRHEIKEHSLKKFLEQWQNAQKMLPALKIYQIHSATFESGVLENTEVLRALDKIRESTGVKIGISVSGAHQKDILQAAFMVKVNNKKLFDSYQATYNVLEQSCFGILKKIMAGGKTVIIKEAIANGRLLENKKLIHYRKTYKLLKELSNKYAVGIDAIALRFIIDLLGPQLVLSGASNALQLDQNVKSLHFKLCQSELSQLELLAIEPDQYWKERSLLFWH